MKKIVFKILRYSGIPILFRELKQKNKVTILMFHDISKETAEKSFSYLKKHYNIIDLNVFIEACQTKNSVNIPKKALIITFDDGHIRNYELLPVIKKYNIPITIFLCSSIVNTNRHYWFKFKQEPEVSALKLKPNKERLRLLAQDGFEKDKEFIKPQALQREQILEMSNYVNMQSHTMFHPILPMCEDDESYKEVTFSKQELENDYNFNINTLAFPNGDYTDREVKFMKEAGYKCGITVDLGLNTINSDIFRLKRLSSNDTEDMNEFIVKSSGVWSALKKINFRKK